MKYIDQDIVQEVKKHKIFSSKINQDNLQELHQDFVNQLNSKISKQNTDPVIVCTQFSFIDNSTFMVQLV